MKYHSFLRPSYDSHAPFSIIPIATWVLIILVCTSVLSRAEDGELFKNTEFADDAKDWKIRFGGNSKGEKEVIEDGHDGHSAIQITIETSGEKVNEIQILQNISLQHGTTYKFHFWGKAEKKATAFTRYSAGGKSNGFDKRVDLTDEWKEYDFDVTPGEETGKSFIVLANLGKSGEGKYWFSEPSITAADGSSSKEEGSESKEDSKSKEKSKSKEESKSDAKSDSGKNAKKYDFEDAGISDIGKVTKVNDSSVTLSLQKTKESYTYNITDQTHFKNGSRDDIKEGAVIAIVPDADPSNAKSVRILESK